MDKVGGYSRPVTWPLLIFFLAFLFVVFPGRGQHSPQWRGLEKALNDLVEGGHVPGVVVGKVDQRGQKEVLAFGKVSYGAEEASVDQRTLFEIGSLTKLFTCLALVDIAREDSVSMNDPLGRYLPDTLDLCSVLRDSVELHHLATHRSGLPRLPANMMPADIENPYADYGLQDLYQYLEAYETTGSRVGSYSYSNLGMGLLGHLLERIEGKPFDRVLKERVMQPLGLRSTWDSVPPAERMRLAKPHSGGREVSYWHMPTLGGAGVLRSDLTDLLKFLQAFITPASSPLENPISRVLDTKYEARPQAFDMGLGWHITSTDSDTIYWHSGGTGGFRSYIGFRRKQKEGIVILANGNFDLKDIGRHYLEPQHPLPDIPRTVDIADTLMNSYTGRYKTGSEVVFDVSRSNDTLFVQIKGQQKYPVYPENDTAFFYKATDGKIGFSEDSTGEVASLTLYQFGQAKVAEKVGELPDRDTPPDTIELSKERAVKYKGRYEVSPRFYFQVTGDGEGLYIQGTGQRRFRILPTSPGHFIYEETGASLDFRIDDSGQVTGLRLHQLGTEISAKKVK